MVKKGKYDHLFISGVDPEIQKQRTYAAIGFLNGNTFKDCNDYNIYWIGAKPYGAYGTSKWGEIMHGPHEHKYPELLIHLGTDPDKPFELGRKSRCTSARRWKRMFLTVRQSFVFPPDWSIHRGAY